MHPLLDIPGYDGRAHDAQQGARSYVTDSQECPSYEGLDGQGRTFLTLLLTPTMRPTVLSSPHPRSPLRMSRIVIPGSEKDTGGERRVYLPTWF